MKLKNLSESMIRKFAGATIFGRGKEYHQNQMVEDIEYDAARDHIQAEVDGSSGHSYDVEITAAKRGIDAACSCPYDGYPCKHIAAVLLTFLEKRKMLLQQSVKNKRKVVSLKERVRALSKNRLAVILLSLAEKYPDCQRDLLIEIGGDAQEALNVIRKQIHRLFRAFESDHYPSSKVVKQLRDIIRSVNQSAAETKVKIYWAVSDKILKELNEYGMDDEPLEDLVIETLDLLTQVLSKQEISQEEKTGIVRALRKYSQWGNCGIIDYINDAIGKIDHH